MATAQDAEIKCFPYRNARRCRLLKNRDFSTVMGRGFWYRRRAPFRREGDRGGLKGLTESWAAAQGLYAANMDASRPRTARSIL